LHGSATQFWSAPQSASVLQVAWQTGAPALVISVSHCPEHVALVSQSDPASQPAAALQIPTRLTFVLQQEPEVQSASDKQDSPEVRGDSSRGGATHN
jgi:hypothetical protein